MSKPFLVETEGPFRKLGKRYVKEVLREGQYQHPTHPWAEPLNATREYMAGVVERTNKGLEAKVDVPIPDGHEDNAKDNTGWVRRAFLDTNEAGTKSIFVEADITDAEYQRKVDDGTINKVSVFLAPFGDGQFDPGGDRLVHVALTSYPVASPQAGFVALSLGGKSDPVPVLKRQEPQMKFSLTAARAKALGLTLPKPDVADDAQLEFDFPEVVAAQEKALAAVPAQIDAVKAESQKALEAAVAAAQVDVAKALSVDPTKERFFSRSKTAFDAAVKAEVDGLVKTGRITLAVVEPLTALLSTEKAYTLALDGKASESDVPALLRKVLACLPEQAAVPVGERVTREGAGVDSPKADPKTLAAAEVEATAKRLAALANGKTV